MDIERGKLTDIPEMNDRDRPALSRGLCETMLVVDGLPIELDAHLRRLGSSVSTLFDVTLDRGVRADLLERVAGFTLGRVRLTARPAAHSIATTVEVEEIDPAILCPPWDRGADLCCVTVANGLGRHKWADRRFLAKAEARLGSTLLLLDAEGGVLEASRANVFAIHDDAVCTPPADGRILAGVTRRRAIEALGDAGLAVSERRLELGELLEADEAFLTGSVRGVEPIRSIDGRQLPRKATVASCLAADLRRRWRFAPAGVL
jgi:para-aminobenzoate synthetase / 4-amino-4-deoxychorismate lyase